MKKADYFAELNEAGKIPEGKTVSDYKLVELEAMYVKHRELEEAVQIKDVSGEPKDVDCNDNDSFTVGEEENTWRTLFMSSSKESVYLLRAMDISGTRNVLVESLIEKYNGYGACISVSSSITTVEGARLVKTKTEGIYKISN